MWTPQIILDSTKNASKGVKKAENSNIKLDTTEADTLCIIQTPSSFNKTTTTDTRNNLKTQNQTHDHTTSSALNSFVRKKISRAESVKNPRRHFKRKPTATLNNHPTILSSYLPLKSYMVKEKALSKPVRQTQHEKRYPKQAISERHGSRTAKNNCTQNSKETFDEFVLRMQHQEDKFAENQYGQRVRPYTSSGYGQLRIKHQRRPCTKSGGIRIHAQKQYPYYQNKAYLPTQHRRKSNKGNAEYKSNGLLNESASKRVDNRATFYGSNKDSFSKDTSTNQTYVSQKHTNMNATYFQNW